MEEYGGLREHHEELRPEGGGDSLLWLFPLKDVREGIGKAFVRALCPPIVCYALNAPLE